MPTSAVQLRHAIHRKRLILTHLVRKLGDSSAVRPPGLRSDDIFCRSRGPQIVIAPQPRPPKTAVLCSMRQHPPARPAKKSVTGLAFTLAGRPLRNRDRGDGYPASPPTRPDMRVRIRRFGGLN
jgi:hypothetical protein